MGKLGFTILMVFVLISCGPAVPIPTEVRPRNTQMQTPHEENDVLPTQSGRLVIHTTPPGAEVILDGQIVGRSPLDVVTSPGAHRLALNLEHYLGWQDIVQVTTGVTSVIDIKLEFQPYELCKVETSVVSRIISLEWTSDNKLRYAILSKLRPIQGTRPQEWSWWTFDPAIYSKQPYAYPSAPIHDPVLESLGIYPNRAALSVSPDGTRLIYTVFDECRQQVGDCPSGYCLFLDCPVWQATADGIDRILLGWTPTPATAAFWSPDGTWAMIYSWDEGGPPWRHLARTDGTFWKEIEQYAGLANVFGCASSPVFSPDSEWLVIEADGLQADCICVIWVVNLATGRAFQVGAPRCLQGPVYWSEDSRYLFVLDDGVLYRFAQEDNFTEPDILSAKIPAPFAPDLIAVSHDQTLIALANVEKNRALVIIQFAPR